MVENAAEQLIELIAKNWDTDKREARKLYDAGYAGLYLMTRLMNLTKSGHLTEDETSQMSELARGLLSIFLRAHQNDERALQQLKAIYKIVYPERYEVPQQAIAKLADTYHTSHGLARGWRIREMMGHLSGVVVPADPHSKSVLEGAVQLSHRLYPKDDWCYQLAAKHWKVGRTLQSLAIQACLEQWRMEGIKGINERSLLRDLRELAAWEKANPHQIEGSIVIHGGENLPIRWHYSEEWKKRYRKRAGKASQMK